MRGYVSVPDSGAGRVPVEAPVEVYRDPGDSQRVLAATESGTMSLGVADVTVSRKKGDTAPVVFVPRAECVEVRNNGNANGVTVRTGDDERAVEEHRVERVTRDATVSVGYQTDLQLTVERDATVEQNVVHRGEGDVVMGDSFDASTTVGDDNVIKGDIGGGDAAPTDTARSGATDVGHDNVIKGDVGGGPTRVGDDNVVSGDVGASDAGSSPPRGDADAGSRFCPKCGTEIAASAAYCPNCGTEQAAPGDTRRFCERHQVTYAGERCPRCADGD
jgi:hypothetical protein